MAAASADRDAKKQAGKLKSYPVAASTTIYKGTLVGLTSTGYLTPMADTAGLQFAGVAFEYVSNASGAAGAAKCRVEREGEFEFVYAGGDAAQALVGELVYAQDDQTVDEDVTLKVQTLAVGRIAEYISTTKVRIDITGFTTAGQGDLPRYAKRRVTAKTADYTVLASETGQAFSNTGASGTITFAMPAATVGLEYVFALGAAQQLRIDPNGTETVSLPSTGVPGAAGKYLVADAIGETVHLFCAVAGSWAVLGYTGTWTAEA